MNKNNITIGITAYNEGQYLQEAWDSVINQTTNNWEAIMILDGGSDIKTEKVFDDISHPSLRKIKLGENNGPYHCRTLAINNTNTEWYCHLDADDYLEESFTRVLNNAIINNPDAEIFFGDIKYIVADNYNLISYKGTNEKIIPYMVYGTVPIKRSIFSDLGGFEKNLYYGGADRDFLFKCGINNKKFIYIPNTILYYVRKRKGSVGENRRNNFSQREKIFFHINITYKQYLIEIKCYDMFICKSLRPIFYYYYSQRKYLQLFSLLFRYGYRAEYFLWRYFGNLILNRIKFIF